MLEEKLNIWEVYARFDSDEVMCIPTNGFVTSRGAAVMGRGVAKQAVCMIPGIKAKVGRAIQRNGNVVQVVEPHGRVPRVLMFPTKPDIGTCSSDKMNVVEHQRHRFSPGAIVPGWALMSDLALISASLDQLEELQHSHNWERVYLPRPGCGAGGLDWEKQVQPLCESTADWLIVVTRGVDVNS